MKKFLLTAALALLVLAGASAQAAYDSAKVKDVMHVNYGAVKDAKKAYDAQDSQAAVQAFKSIVEADKPLLAMNPPKGPKADWDKAFTQLIDTAQKGADAAKAKDWPAVKAALDSLRKIQGEGHGEFKG